MTLFYFRVDLCRLSPRNYPSEPFLQPLDNTVNKKNIFLIISFNQIYMLMSRVLEIHRRKWTNSKPCRRFVSRLTPTWQEPHVSRYLCCHEYPEQFLSVTVIRANSWQAAGKYISQMMVEFHFPCTRHVISCSLSAVLLRIIRWRVGMALPHTSHQTKSFFESYTSLRLLPSPSPFVLLFSGRILSSLSSAGK